MAIVITYDINAKHVKFKKAMFQLGYKDKIPDTNCDIIYFPNTTLYHTSKTSETAREEARTVCKNLSIQLERCIATQWGPQWAVICGEPF